MISYSVEIRSYDCHPETCCHEEHLGYWVVQHRPIRGSPVHYGESWVEGFYTRKEAEKALEFIKDE